MNSTEIEDEIIDSSNGLRPDEILLRDAWFEFAPERLKQLFRRVAPNREAVINQQLNMRKLLQSGLEGGRYVATGIEHGSNADFGRANIPAYFFGMSAEIDWQKNRLDVFGRTFSELHVSKNPNRRRNSEALIKPAIEDKAEAPAALIGRPPTIGMVIEIAKSLQSQSRFVGLSPKEQETLIRNLCREMYPERFPRPTQPSKNKIIEARRKLGLVPKTVQKVK